MKEHANRTVTFSELFSEWRKPPYGVKDGMMPLLAVAFVLSQRDKIAIYRDGIFRAKFDDVDVDYLAKDPAFIQLRWMDLSDVSRRLLSGMAEVVRDLDKTNELAHLEPIDVGRGLVAIYDQFPKWTKRTMRLSSNAVNIRDLFKRAHDPNQFLFDDIPGTLKEDVTLANDKNLRRVIGKRPRGTGGTGTGLPRHAASFARSHACGVTGPEHLATVTRGIARARREHQAACRRLPARRLCRSVVAIRRFGRALRRHRQPCRKQAAA